MLKTAKSADQVLAEWLGYTNTTPLQGSTGRRKASG